MAIKVAKYSNTKNDKYTTNDEIEKLILQAKRYTDPETGKYDYYSDVDVADFPLFTHRYTDNSVDLVKSWRDIYYPRNKLYYILVKNLPKRLQDKLLNLKASDVGTNTRSDISLDTTLVYDSTGKNLSYDELKFIKQQFPNYAKDAVSIENKDMIADFIDQYDPRDILYENVLKANKQRYQTSYERYFNQQREKGNNLLISTPQAILSAEPQNANVVETGSNKENFYINTGTSENAPLLTGTHIGVPGGTGTMSPAVLAGPKINLAPPNFQGVYVDYPYGDLSYTNYELEPIESEPIPTTTFNSLPMNWGFNLNYRDYDWDDDEEKKQTTLIAQLYPDYMKYLIPYMFSDLREKPFKKEDGKEVKVKLMALGGDTLKPKRKLLDIATMFAQPDLYEGEIEDIDFIKELFEPLGIRHNSIGNVPPEEAHKYTIKRFDEGGALVVDNGDTLIDNLDWNTYAQQKFSEYNNYQIVPDLTEEELNVFDDGGFTYIPNNQQNMVVNPFEFEGIRYGWLPNGGTGEDVYKERNDRNGVYVRWDNDNNKWAKTTVPRDLGNIKNYFANRHNELATYNDNAPAANAYDANSELNKTNIANQLYWDPVNKEIRNRLLSQDLSSYTAGNFLNTIIPIHLISPSNYIGAMGEAARENDNFFLNALSGLNKGIFSLSDDLSNWSDKHPYLSIAGNFVGDAFGFGMLGDTAKLINSANKIYNTYKLSNALNKSIKNSNFNWNYDRPNFIRTKIGDLTIEPQSSYRQGSYEQGMDFINSGKVVAKSTNASNKSGLTLLGKLFDNPMFALGNLWYGDPITHPTAKNLSVLVTREPLAIASKSSKRLKHPANGTSDIINVRESSSGSRRVPLNEDLLNPTNTTLYNYEPEYGYRKFNNLPKYDYDFNKQTNTQLNVFEEMRWNPETGDFEILTPEEQAMIQEARHQEFNNYLESAKNNKKIESPIRSAFSEGSEFNLRPIPQNAINIIENLVFTRLTPEEIIKANPGHEDHLKWFVNNKLHNDNYLSVSDNVFDELGRENTLGQARVGGYPVTVRAGYEEQALPHEMRHLIDFEFNLPSKYKSALNDVFGERFETLPEWVDKYDSLKGYKNMKGEKVTTNLDTRLKLLPKHLQNESVELQNLFIDKVSDEKIVKALQESNGYGRRYVQRLKQENNGKVPQSIIDGLRWTLKNVGVGTGVAYGIGTTQQ